METAPEGNQCTDPALLAELSVSELPAQIVVLPIVVTVGFVCIVIRIESKALHPFTSAALMYIRRLPGVEALKTGLEMFGLETY